MRTPNTTCVLCHKPLYRRPTELAKIRYAACMSCRSTAQSVVGVTAAQRAGLALGAKKGTNYRNGRLDTPETRAKKSKSCREFYETRPDVAAARGEKTRGENHYRWNGGSSQLNKSIRRMDENRKWAAAVKVRNGRRCVACGSTERLESHHIIEMADLISEHHITNRDEARACTELWDINNGKTLCVPCHYSQHGRTLCA